MRIINKWNTGIHRFVSKTRSRYNLNGILVTKNETVSTDGHVLISVTMPPQENELPAMPEGFKADNGSGKGFVMPIDSVKAVEKNIPNVKLKTSLNNAVIDTSGIDKDGSGTAKFQTNDLAQAQVVNVRAVEGKFPDYSKVVPAADEAVYTIEFNGKLLGALLDYMGKFASDESNTVRLSLYGKGEDELAMRIDSKNTITEQEAVGVVMPLKA